MNILKTRTNISIIEDGGCLHFNAPGFMTSFDLGEVGLKKLYEFLEYCLNDASYVEDEPFTLNATGPILFWAEEEEETGARNIGIDNGIVRVIVNLNEKEIEKLLLEINPKS